MSCFTCMCRKRKTKKVVEVFCWDDYFGSHQYGYQINLSGPVLTEEEFGKKYERLERNTPPANEEKK